MSLIARFDGRNAPARTDACTTKAQQAGFVNVEATYRPQTGTYEVTGDLPATTAQRTVDRILGR